MLHQQPAFLFDLDGTLVDSVYQHVLAWREALEAEKIELSVWRIHRKIGMSGGLFTNMLLRETGLHIDPERVHRLQPFSTDGQPDQSGVGKIPKGLCRSRGDERLRSSSHRREIRN